MTRGQIFFAAIAPRHALFIIAGLLAGEPALAAEFFSIRVEDAADGTPVPCISMTTTSDIRVVSDINGNIAWYEPGLMNLPVWFEVEGDGYEVPADTFGRRGLRLTPIEGAAITLEVTNTGLSTPCSVGNDATLLLAGSVPDRARLFKIEVIDVETGRGVPLIEVRSSTQTWWTDSAGLVAFYEPDAMNQTVFFEVHGHGYEAADPAGGAVVTTTEGGGAQLQVRRISIAERLYRVTGQGIYRDSVLLGESVPIEDAVLNGRVVGQDTVRTAIYKGKAFLIWGDTEKASYSLGNFHASGARADLPGMGGLDPEVGVNLRYYVDAEGFSKPMAPPGTVPGEGVTWLGTLMVVPDAGGAERLYARYGKYRGLGDRAGRGLILFNDSTEQFETVATYADTDVPVPGPHVFAYSHADGSQWRYLGPYVRVSARAEAVADLSTYQVFTALAQGTTDQLERNPDGTIAYAWKTQTAKVGRVMITDGIISATEAVIDQLRDPDTGHEPIEWGGSVFWNAYRGRFTRIENEGFGSVSLLGEVWFAEADSPMGPWVYARRIALHDDYSCYQPSQRPYFDQQDGRILYWECTYTATFSGAPVKTPRYDYNNIMHRIDLDDDRLKLPVAVYDLSEDGSGTYVTKQGLREAAGMLRPPFFAYDRPPPGAIAVGWQGAQCDSPRLVAGEGVVDNSFWALPHDLASPPPGTVPLYEYVTSEGFAYSVDTVLADYTRNDPPVARVWSNPMEVALPITDYLSPLIADAGPDLCLQQRIADKDLEVLVDGSGSRARDGTVLSYQWRHEGADITVSTARTVLNLSPGVHRVELTVETDLGRRASDVLIIRVAPAADEQPTADAGPADGGVADGSAGDAVQSRGDSGDSDSVQSHVSRGCGCAGTSTLPLPLLVLLFWRRPKGRVACWA